MTLKGNRWGIQAWRRRHDAAYGGAGEEWTPADPLPVSGLLPEHWYRSDQGLWQDAGVTPATSDGDVVGRWEDLTANADHLNQAAAGNKPTLQNGAGDLLNGHAAIRFDGASDYLQGTYTTGGAMASPNTIFVVAALDATRVNVDVFDYIFDDSAVLNCQALCINGGSVPDAWRIRQDNATSLVGSIATSANPIIFTCLYNSAASQFWMNGISSAAGNAGAANAMSGITIGARQDKGAATFYKGDMFEILVYEPNLSDADKNTVGQYLATRYALAYTDI